jgi:type II secretory pathway component GspD/PulD (secretin)
MSAPPRAIALALGLLALGAGGAGPSFAESDQPPARSEGFSERAEQYLEAAKERLKAKEAEGLLREQARQAAELARRRARERAAAQKLAIEMTREQLQQRSAQAREAQQQLRLARERQLKALYQKALDRYEAGAYEEAVALLQQMALVDPQHPLLKAGERLMTRAELKRFEQQLRAGGADALRGANVPELEELLAQKRMELETVLKYARIALQERRYDMALKLCTAILVQDPLNRDAQQLAEQVHLAKLTEEETRLRAQGARDDEAMRNEILKAQLLPSGRQSLLPPVPRSAGRPNAALAAKLQQPISFEFEQVALSDVLSFLADAANISIVPSPQLDLKSQRVSLKVKELPLEQAVKYLVKSLSLSYRVEEDAIIIAAPAEFLSEPLQTRVFLLRNGFSPFALKTAALQSNPQLAMEPLAELLDRSVPKAPNSKLVIDERSGSLIATNTEEHLRLLERLLGQLDVAPLQVLIEARFVELTLTDLEHFALESVLTGNLALDKKGAGDGTASPANQVAGSGGFKFPALSRESEGLNLTLQGVLTGTQFESVLHLLEESKKTKTLSAPRVTTLNNQTAMIRVVEEFNYPTRYEVSLIQFDINGDGDFDDAGETEFANVPQDLQTRDIGILLNVTPSVGHDGKTITLVVAPEVSAFSQFRDLGGGVTVPEFTSSQLTTSIVIEDGQTVVLGGLMKDTTSRQTTKVPLLGDLPLLGHLFKQTDESSTRKNLLIFITARLLAPRGPTA